MAATVLFSQTRDGTQVAEFPQAVDLVYSYRLNAPGAIGFALPAEKIPGPTTLDYTPVAMTWGGEPMTWDGEPATWSTSQQVTNRTTPIADVLEDGVHEIGIRRGGRVVWLGPLLTVDETHGQQIRFGGEGLAAYLRRWNITAALPGTNAAGEYTAVDSGLLAKRLVDHHQAKGGGDFGIDTTGTPTTGIDVENTEVAPWKGANIYDLFAAVAEADQGGFDWEIRPDTRALTLHSPRAGIRRRDLVFDEANGVAFQRRRDATQQASSVIGFGDGDEAQTLRRVRTDSTAVARYGLTQRVLSLPNEASVAALDAQVQAALATWKTSANILAATFRPDALRVPLFSFALGDRVRVTWDSPWRPVNTWRRVVGLDIRPHPDELVTAYLEET